MEESDRILIEWLERHGPDEWHCVARSWNWDQGYAVLTWIATQPQCDRATAQHLFLLSSPEYFLQFPTREDVLQKAGHAIENFDFTMLVVNRWNSGSYKRSEIATAESDNTVRHLERAYRSNEARYAGKLPWAAGHDIFVVLDGRDVKGEDFSEGYPPDVASELRQKGIRS
jgi:hypothetical protein